MTRSKLNFDDTVAAEAASWVVQLDEGNLSADDKLALTEWINRSPRHAHEIRKFSALWAQVDVKVDEALAGYLKSNTSTFQFLRALVSVKPKSFAALVFSVFFAAFVSLNHLSAEPSNEGLENQTIVLNVGVGDDLKEVLSDGSVVHLNTDTVVEVDYSAKSRSIKLIRGEAFFDVVKDENRPFRVFAKENVVVAVGTQFIVRLDSDKLEVIVQEGRVRIGDSDNETQSIIEKASNAFAQEKPVFLDIGQVAVIDDEVKKLVDLAPVILERKQAWRNGDLVFAGDTLAHVVSELGRYNNVDITMSPELRNLTIGGRFKVTDVDRILEAIDLSEGIKSRKLDDGTIYLFR